MPNATSVTVKDSANADKVYDVQSPASGVNPAQYELTAASGKKAFRPQIDVVNRAVNGSGSARKGLITGYFPVVETVGGVEQSTKGTFIKVEVKTDTMVDDAVLTDHVTQFLNFCANAGIKKSLANGQNQT